MENLFGHLCSGSEFSHDAEMRELIDQDEELRPRKRARRYSNSTAEQSTQRSVIETSLSQEVPMIDLEEITYPALPQVTPVQQRSQHSDEQPLNGMDITTTDTEQSLSAPSQLTRNGSQSQHNGYSTSPDTRIQALKQALKQKALNNELNFDLESSLADSQSQQHLSISQPFLSSLEEEEEEEEEADKNDAHDGEEGNADEEPDKALVDIDTNPQLIPEITEEGEETDDYRSTKVSSISSSGFASQDTVPLLSDDDDIDNGQEKPQTDSRPPFKSGRSRASLKRTHSRRMAAYRAARDESWPSLYSLVSAGNNHSIREEEL